MGILGKIYKIVIGIIAVLSCIIIVPLMIPFWIIFEVGSRIAEREIDKAEKGEFEDGPED